MTLLILQGGDQCRLERQLRKERTTLLVLFKFISDKLTEVIK